MAGLVYEYKHYANSTLVTFKKAHQRPRTSDRPRINPSATPDDDRGSQ